MKGEIIRKERNEFLYNDTILTSDPSKMKRILNRKALSILNSLSNKPLNLSRIIKQVRLRKKEVESALSFMSDMGLIRELRSGSKELVYEKIAGSVTFDIDPVFRGSSLMNANDMDSNVRRFYNTFLDKGEFNGYICVGSSDPHGEYKAIAKDTNYAIYLGMFFGRYVSLPKDFPIVLDTDVISRNLFGSDLMVIGGPVTNMVTRDINNFLPVKFFKEEGWMLKYKDNIYGNENEGVIERIRNPYDKSKTIILLSGIKNKGTLSAILAATKFASSTFKNYQGEQTWHTIIRGYDVSGKGSIDVVEPVY
ncbi:MAG: hypothetical protein QXJ12_01430 [Candidatus Parvarchaeota archaeon]|nr:hypothetical protein [Candidatus Parvarchaeota archaeon]